MSAKICPKRAQFAFWLVDHQNVSGDFKDLLMIGHQNHINDKRYFKESRECSE